jgi:hypothetical protein
MPTTNLTNQGAVYYTGLKLLVNFLFTIMIEKASLH